MFNLMPKKVLLWKSMGAGLKSSRGNIWWEIGKWLKEDGISLCNRGFHASVNPLQAMGYVNCEIIARVEVRGKHIKQDDKQVWEEMRIVEAYKWNKKDSVALSIFAAELCIKNYESLYPDDARPRNAIEAAKKWLLDPTTENESAARSAESAAWSAESAAKKKIETACNEFVIERIKNKKPL